MTSHNASNYRLRKAWRLLAASQYHIGDHDFYLHCKAEHLRLLADYKAPPPARTRGIKKAIRRRFWNRFFGLVK